MIKKTNAIININSVQKYEKEEDAIDIITEGNFYFKNGKYYIFYNEGEKLETQSRLTVDDKSITIKRTGAYASEFTCEENITTSFVYNMPYGAVVLDVDTKCVESSLDETGGNLFLEYTLNMNGEKYLNTISITVRKNK